MRSAVPQTPHASSWTELVAATAFGVVGASTVRAEVKANVPGLIEGREYRLVLQSYDARDGRPPRRDARPIGSAQRAVTAAELRAGVRLSLIELPSAAADPRSPSEDAPVVIAWIEDGIASIDYDTRRARPQRGNLYGSARRRESHDVVRIALKRKLAA